METARSNLEDNAVTRAGHESSDFVSGNNALGTWFLIFSIMCSWFFSIKKTGILFLIKDLFASEINLYIDQLFFLYSFPWVMEKPI